MNIYTQAAHLTLRIQTKRSALRLIIIKSLKDKDKRESREHQERTCHLQEILNDSNSLSLKRHHGGQKAVK